MRPRVMLHPLLAVDVLVRKILRRHRASLRGALCHRKLRSEALGIAKPYLVYEPPGVALLEKLPVLYLFRGHEREWANPHEDASRRTTAIEDLDWLIHEERLPPLVAVMPGLSSADNHIPALGINMAGTWPDAKQGLGTGRFWTFLTEELIPSIDRRYPQAEGGLRLMAGFSLGGYTVSLLAMQHAGYFDHAALYDGTLMWPGHRDPRAKEKKPSPKQKKETAASTHRTSPAPAGCTDPIWCRAGLFNAALGHPRDAAALKRWNPTDTLRDAEAGALAAMQRTTLWLRCAAADGGKGNRDRARFFAKLLRERGLPLGFEGGDVVLHPEAAHTWHWADRFLVLFLSGIFSAVAVP